MEDEKKLEPKRQSQTSKETMIAIAEKETEVKEESKEKNSLQTLRAELAKEKELKKQMSEKAVITPNYDMIKEISPEKRKKIYKIQKVESQQEAKPYKFSKKLKIILFSLVFLVGGAFCLTSGIQLADTINSLNAAQTQYEANLPKLIKKISGIDNSNTALELIETYPDELKDPSSIAESTNWFDKFCNFISGLFGG